MNLAQKIVVGITVPLVLLSLVLGIVLSAISLPFMGEPMMMHGGRCGVWGYYGLGYIGFALAIVFALIGAVEFWLFRSRTTAAPPSG